MPARRNPFSHRLSTTLVISILYPLGPAAIILAPMIVGGVMDSYGFTDQQAGTVASMEGLGLVVASIFASLWIRKIAWTLSLIHISEPTRLGMLSRMPSSA